MATLELITPEGRRVMLHDDHTWEYLSSDKARQNAAEAEPYAVLRVSHVKEMGGSACGLGVTLENGLPYKIKNLSIRFSAYKSESLLYESVTRGFYEIKSTDRQYQKLGFRGISCSGIHHIKVEDPGRCSMGSLDRFSSRPGDCIKHIKIEPSKLINIVK